MKKTQFSFNSMRSILLGSLLLFSAVAGAQNITPNLFATGEDTSATAATRAVSLSKQQQQADLPQLKLPQQADYRANAASDVFGAQLFTGAFVSQAAAFHNPYYLIGIGDRVQVRLWGAYDYEALLTVDTQGNIFLPTVGPVKLLGVQNKILQRTVQAAVHRVFKANVQSYASLAAAQPVRVYVSGNIRRPGLYDGTSTAGLLHYLDQAGGVDPERGSFLEVQVKRGSRIRAKINLYDFLLNGEMPALQLESGDVIFVTAKKGSIKVTGLVEHANSFEISKNITKVSDLVNLARPMPAVTNVRIVRNTGKVQYTEYYSLAEAKNIVLQDGDILEFTADKQLGTISVRVEGEHDGAQEYVLPYGSKLGTVLQQLQLQPYSDLANIQLFRRSVKQQQKELLETSLKNLEMAVLTARSGSTDEARLRKEEADLTLQWIDRARKIEPLGQVIIATDANNAELLLENGDKLIVPRKADLILVSGEVLFPSAVVYKKGLKLRDYIAQSGGFTQTADASRVVVAKVNGQFHQINSRQYSRVDIAAGDKVLVLPKVDSKRRQFWKEMTQILYQLAVSARVVVGL